MPECTKRCKDMIAMDAHIRLQLAAGWGSHAQSRFAWPCPCLGAAAACAQSAAKTRTHFAKSDLVHAKTNTVVTHPLLTMWHQT